MSLFTPCIAWADACSDILRPELLSRSLRQGGNASSAAETKWACSATLGELNSYFAQASSQQGGGKAKLHIFGVMSGSGGGSSGGSNSVTQGQFESWKAQNCGRETADQARSAFEFYAHQELSTEAIRAWRACKLSQSPQPLTCWISPQGAEDVIFNYIWKSSAADLPVVKEFVARIKGSNYKLALPGDRIFLGHGTKTVARSDTVSIIVTLTVILGDRYSYSCSVTAPPTKTAARSLDWEMRPMGSASGLDLVGTWCSGSEAWRWGKVAGSDHLLAIEHIRSKYDTGSPERFMILEIVNRPAHFELKADYSEYSLLDFTYLRLSSSSIRHLNSGALLTKCSG